MYRFWCMETETTQAEQSDFAREEILIEAVRDLPCLWKVNCKEYRDTRAKENAWKQVATKVTKYLKMAMIVQTDILYKILVNFKVRDTVSECQRRWRLLRDRFVRGLRKATIEKQVKKGHHVNLVDHSTK